MDQENISDKDNYFLLKIFRSGKSIKEVAIKTAIVLLAFYFLFLGTPSDFPKGSIVSIENGETLNGIASSLKEKNVIKSKFLFKNLVRVFGGRVGAKSGDYSFDNRQNVFTVASRISSGDFGLNPIKITIPEGLNSDEMVSLFKKNGFMVNEKELAKLAFLEQGFLFPDTYLFLPNVSADQIVSTMKDNFYKKIEPYRNEIERFGKPLYDVIKMASIVEGEARQMETRKVIAGILWKRIDIGQPLQVDVSFKMINGKNSYNLTLEDLSIDSPFNTYKYKGLPPSPISNPSLDSILATINPTKTPYFYFLTDSSGKMHYASTFEGHVMNKELYLR